MWGHWQMPRPKIKPNGHPGEWELVWSAAELTFGAVLLSAVLSGGGTILWTLIELGRDVTDHNGYWEGRDKEIERRLNDLERGHNR